MGAQCVGSNRPMNRPMNRLRTNPTARPMTRVLCAASLLILAGGLAAGQKPATSPANEPRLVRTVRSRHSVGADLKVPLCPSEFHDSLQSDGIAGARDKDVTLPQVKKSVPALITQQAIKGAGTTHIGNYLVIVNVVVNTKGIPSHLCLQKSSGYGLDASAANAVSDYRFDPAKENGKPVRIRVPVEVRFVAPTPTAMGEPHTGLPPK